MSWLFENERWARGGGVAAEERGEQGQHEEEKEREEIGEGGGEGWLWLAARRLSSTGTSAWCTAAELVDADAWTAAQIENEAGAGVEATCLCVSLSAVPS